MIPDFELTDEDFARARALARARVGIEFPEAKRALVYGRLSRRLRQLGLRRFRDYLDLVEADDAAEGAAFVNALTTNVTDFFREAHHFEFLEQVALPVLRQTPGERRLRFWSAGCSTGEEPYSLAMVLREAFPEPGWNIRILATDIDSDVLAFARAGVYSEERARRIPPARRERWFSRTTVDGRPCRLASEELRAMIAFKRLNLLQSWPMQGPFDAIFCRNVIIYFDTRTKTELVKRFGRILAPHGHLFFGHSESLTSAAFKLKPCGRTVYRKSDEPEVP